MDVILNSNLDILTNQCVGDGNTRARHYGNERDLVYKDMNAKIRPPK